ncbi:IS701 family transposase [Richelia sinica]|uniref:IS701 family transposase n=1 Tax=Richelia sinica TaxID=1357545 RepID=UPI001C2B9F55|nr:IS701 family transposase [Richelia sinica]
MNLPRKATKTVSFVDEYCEAYKDIFPEVRSYECFKYLHLGMISEVKRKTLPAIAKIVGITNAQSLHHFLKESPWSVEKLRDRRLKLLSKALKEKKFILVIDETGDKKKGKKTDYVDRQYIGNLGKIEQGIVSVNAYGIWEEAVFPLICKVYKPQKRLKPEDKYQTKIEIAREIIEELLQRQFKFEVVLADSLYGESSEFRRTLEKHNLKYVVAIRSNHGVLMPAGGRVRRNRWQEFDRVFTTGKKEKRYIREIIFGHRRGDIRYWEITTDTEKLPENSTWYIMTNLPGKIQKSVGNTYGLRTWIEYGFKQCKNELGWADYRVTDYAEIEKWWEIVLCVFLMVSLQSPSFIKLAADNCIINSPSLLSQFQQHPWWQFDQGWKHILNNFRLIIQPAIFLALILPWLSVFSFPSVYQYLSKLVALMNQFHVYVPSG